MDEYQEVIWSALDDYHQRLWAPTIGMHGPWNDYQLIKYERQEPFMDSLAKNIRFNDEEKDLKRLESIIKKAYKIEDHKQRVEALEKRITGRVRPLVAREYFERLKTIESLGRYPGKYFELQDLERELGRYLDR